ncbi:MAG TPA: nidogen-like domain-containing protein [Bryobacteraceae bacterium]|nr:nidogen-like domain-containing protein [Bryobacteraceae bacterium]
MFTSRAFFWLSTFSFTFAAASLPAAAVVSGVLSSTLPATGDASASPVNIGFNVNWGGTTYSQLSVNENGNITFADAGYSDYSAGSLTQTQRPIIAPFLADVDLTNHGQVTYGNLMAGGKQAFAVDYTNVGYYGDSLFGADKTNSFQVLLINNGTGNFGIELNYDSIQWESGLASGGIDGLGGGSAIAGYSTTGTAAGATFELAGSAVDGALLDGGANSLVSDSYNARDGVSGRYDFNVVNGAVAPAPEPLSIALFAAGLVTVAAIKRKRRRG